MQPGAGDENGSQGFTGTWKVPETDGGDGYTAA